MMPFVEPDATGDDRGVLKYQQDDNFFRQPITAQDLADTPRISVDDFSDRADYMKLVKDLPFVVFIDLGDVAKYLRVIPIDGLGALDVRAIATVVCDCLGEDSNIPDMLWGAFEDEVAAEIQAKLGLEDGDTTAVLMGGPFDNSMEVLYEIANVVQRYLINARFPIVEMESIYQVEDYKNGVLALGLKSYDQFVEAYRGEDEDTATEQRLFEQEIAESTKGRDQTFLVSGGTAQPEPGASLHDKVLDILDPTSPAYRDTDDGALDRLDAITALYEEERRERAFKASGATWKPEPASDLDQYGHFDEQDKWVNADGTKPADNMKPYDDQ